MICGNVNINIVEFNESIDCYKYKLINSFNYDFIIKQPTRVTSTNSTCIDHVIIKIETQNNINARLLDYDLTDHKGIAIKISTKHKEVLKTKKTRIHTIKNIETFCSSLNKTVWFEHLDPLKNINENLDYFVSLVYDKNIKSFPLINLKNKKENCPWIKKQFLLKQVKVYQKGRDIEDLKRLTKSIKSFIYKAKNKYFLNFFSKANCNDKWKQVNKMIKEKCKDKGTEINIDNQTFVEYFSSIFSEHNTAGNFKPNLYINSSAFIYPAKSSEIMVCFMKLKNKKTHQENNIPMFLWRIIANSILEPTKFLINQMLATAIFPSVFKKADVIPIYKKGDKKKPNNYRPITTLHNLSKVFERVILNRILSFCDRNHILPKSQYGFRPKYSTKDAIVTLLLESEKK